MRKVVLVTGAARGIGRDIAIELAKRGVAVAVHFGTSAAEAETLVQELAGEGHRCFQADLTKPEECESLVQAVVAQMGRLDVLINNAGVVIDKDVRDYTYEGWQEQWNKTMDINYYAASNLAYLASRQFLTQGARTESDPEKGRIVSISSRAAYAGDVNAPAYAVSKCAMNAMMQSLGKGLAADGIYFYIVAPGATDTEMWGKILTVEQRQAMDASHPLGRIGRPGEVATAVGWFALEAPALMTCCVADANGGIYTH
jgi:3-oxoacyl-[acyl-carrier protein] reductase